MSCDVGKAAEELENELYVVEVMVRLKNEQSSFYNHSVTSPTSQLILQPYPRFTYVTAYFRSFSNLTVTSPTSQLIRQPFLRVTYVTAHSSTLPLLHLRHSSFSNPYVASPTSQALHLIHLASRPYSVR